jgi:cation diffusion facilitator CzcD-associated flavoprotein CzcO
MERIDTLVVGAGPAGLAMAHELGARGLPYMIIERAQTLAPTWHRHYQRLHLHTAKRYSSLPGMPFPGDAPTFPSREQVIDYLNAYAARFGIAPRFGVTVTRVTPAGQRGEDGWQVQTEGDGIVANQVVLATGLNAVPIQPQWPGMSEYRGELLHSSGYINGARFGGRRVLVVGAGNSGAEIALDLVEHGAHADLCVRGKLHVALRRTLGLPAPLPTILLAKLPIDVADAIARSALKLTVGDLARYGIEPPDYGPIRSMVEHGRVPLIDVGTLARIKQGDIAVKKGIWHFTETGVIFVEGTQANYDAIVLATGYRSGLEELLGDVSDVLDARGRALNEGIGSRPGLYLLGYATPATGLLREIGILAPKIAEHIRVRRLRTKIRKIGQARL